MSTIKKIAPHVPSVGAAMFFTLLLAISMIAAPVYAQVSVGTSTASTALANPIQRKLVTNDSGRNWEFYSDGTNIVFRSCLVTDSCSTNASKWSGATTVRAGTDGRAFSVFVNSTRDAKVYYVFAIKSASSSKFFYRAGTLNADGTITWNFAESSVSTTRQISATGRPTLAVDLNGDLIVALQTCGTSFCFNGFTLRTVEVWKCAAPISGCAWSQIYFRSYYYYDIDVAILPFFSNKLVLLITANDGQDTAGMQTCPTSCSGTSSWSTFVHTVGHYYMGGSSAITVGDTLYFAGMGSIVCCSIIFWTCSYPCSTTSTETKLYTSNFNYIDAGIATDRKSTLVITGSDPSTSSVFHFLSTNSGSTWGSKVTDASSESNLKVQSLAGSPYISSCTAAESWLTGSSSPFSVRYLSFAVC